MKIETKLDVGDEVFFMQSNKVHIAEISEVRTKSKVGIYNTTVTSTYYDIHKNPEGSQHSTSGFTDNELFKTKEELLATL